MPSMFHDPERRAADPLIELALAEDLGDGGDLTVQALVNERDRADVRVVARQEGVLAGAPLAQMVFQRLDPQVAWKAPLEDGSWLEPGTTVAVVSGPLGSLLSGERTALNFLTHLSGVATLTRRFVEAVRGTQVRILDTRKTLPGWRVLEKYAVRAGGGTNHRMGLFDGCLIKDNHLAAWTAPGQPGDGAAAPPTIADAVRQARSRVPAGVPVEVEVDTLEQLADALRAAPDVVLLDNMDPAMLRRAVALRDGAAPGTALEASGGIRLENVREIAESGVERISIGALTHSAPALDLAFDWEGGEGRGWR